MTMWTLHISHRTEYAYTAPVRESKNETRMTPAKTPRQQVLNSTLLVDPDPTHHVSYRDYFGTIVDRFEIAAPHDTLAVVHQATVLSGPQADVHDEGQATGLRREHALEYLYRSPMVDPDPAVIELARSLRREAVVDTLSEVVRWMRTEMSYDKSSTVVGTSVGEVFQHRSGVCQDYAHLACALLREVEIPARYVSGYFSPSELAVGDHVEAESHAWIEAFIEGWGWFAADITNDLIIGERHVKVGHGRDYSDVIPMHGVHVGTAEQTLDVSVIIERLPDSDA